jgi:ribosomal protein S18 acetylase RimI-like enzyme
MPIVRRGTVGDIEDLLRLRAVMFDAMNVDFERADWGPACRQILLDGLSSGDLVAVVAEAEDGRVVACGIGAVRRWLPSPRNPSGLRGYIGSMATEEEWRRQGIGRHVVECVIEILRGRGVSEIDLHTTEDGEGLYRAVGFVDRDKGADLRLGTDADPTLSPDL